jgi:hypothetical protein
VKRAVIVVEPWATPVTRPGVVALSVATEVLLELHTTWPVRFSVAPDAVVPMAMN